MGNQDQETVMHLTIQDAQSGFKDFPQNVWRQQSEVVLAYFHNVGTNNNLHTNSQYIQEHLRRNAANLTWLDQIFERASSAKALAIFTHANVKFDTLPWDPTGFDSFVLR